MYNKPRKNKTEFEACGANDKKLESLDRTIKVKFFLTQDELTDFLLVVKKLKG